MTGEGEAADELTLMDDRASQDMGVVSAGADGFPDARRENDFVVDSGVSFGEVAENGVVFDGDSFAEERGNFAHF